MSDHKWKRHKKYTDAELEAYEKLNSDDVSKIRWRTPSDSAEKKTIAIVINGKVHLVSDDEEKE